MELLMHLDILDKKRIHLLKNIVDAIHSPSYYMAGGTALSLQLGLRKSVDFDFFVPDRFNSELLFQQLKNLDCHIEVIHVYDGTYDVLLDGIQVSFFYYPQNMLRPYIIPDGWNGLLLASPEDIAVMKAAAIGSRGAKKDFFDLYQILHLTDFTISDLAEGLFQKFGSEHDFSYIGMGLNYFEDAEKESLPPVYVDYNWDKIKNYFSDIQGSFFDQLRIRSVKR